MLFDFMSADNLVNNTQTAIFEVIIAMTMERAVFWDVPPCSPAEVH
jgi:hypothetical protein